MFIGSVSSGGRKIPARYMKETSMFIHFFKISDVRNFSCAWNYKKITIEKNAPVKIESVAMIQVQCQSNNIF